MKEGLPDILLADQSGQDHGVALEWLQSVATEALVGALALQQEESVLPQLSEIEVTLVDDAAITEVHREFMDLATPTDVITFHHGEILVSVETAARQAPDYERTMPQEVALYVVHGLLHLAGFHDKAEEDFHRMASTQERLLAQALEGLP